MSAAKPKQLSQPRSRPQSRRLRRRESATAYAFVAPTLFGVAAFMLVPVLVLVVLSFSSWDVLSEPKLVGFDNWQTAFTDPAVWRSLGVTALFVLLVVPAQIAIGLWLATLLVRELPGSAFIRTVLVLPWVCAPVVLGIVWRWIFQYDGVVNNLFDIHVPWLQSEATALPIVAFVQAWSQIGYVSLFFMAGLGSIPNEVIEAARIDGANARQIFWRIKLPLLKPTMFFVLVTGMIAAFQSFDLVYSLSPDGGPGGTTDLIAARVYSQAVPQSNIGQAAVLAIILFVALIIITLIQNAYFSRKTTYER